MRTFLAVFLFASLAAADVKPENPHVTTAASAAHGEGHAAPAANPHAAPAADSHAAPTPHGMPAAHGAPAAHGDAHGAAAAHRGEHAGGHGGAHTLAPINWSDFSNKEQPPYVALAINLALLLAIYYYFGKKPVVDGLKKRKEDIAKEIEDAARMKKDAEARAQKYQASLANLDKDLETTKKGLEDAGRVEKQKLVTEAKEKAERMKKDATFLVQQEAKQAEVDLKREAILGSFAHAESFLTSRVTDDDHDRLCLEFLTELSKKKPLEVSR